MSDSESQVTEKKKSLIGIILVLIILLAGLSGIWINQKQSSQESDIAYAGSSDNLDIAYLSTPRILGDKSAPLKISEHSSFTCPGCAKFHSSNFKKIKVDYIDTGKAYLVYDDFARNSKDATVGAIARCVPEESYFKFIQLIFETQSDWRNDLDLVNESALMVGADADKINKCANSKDLKEAIAQSSRKAYKEKGVDKTPTLLIGESGKVSGLAPYHEIQQVINKALAEIENDKVIQPEDIPDPIETAAGEPEEEAEQKSEETKKSSSNEFDLKKAKKPRILGDVNAPIQIIEHSSFSCPHCADFHHNTFPKLKADYIDTGKAYLIFDDFPLGGPDVLIGALARCVPDDSYFNFVQFIFENQEEWKKAPKYLDYLKQNAKLTGATDEELQKCIDSKELQETIAMRGHNAYERKKVSGTPTLIINDGHPISALSPYPDLQEILNKELQKESQ